MSSALKKIKLIYLLGINIVYFGCAGKPTQTTSFVTDRNVEDSEFIHYFRLLDSAAATVKNDTIVYGCIGPISFMEYNTKIEASSPGTFAGKMYFTKSDLVRWHSWYENNRKVKRARQRQSN